MIDIFAPLKQTCLILFFLIQLIAVRAQVNDSTQVIKTIHADSGQIKSPLVDTMSQAKDSITTVKTPVTVSIQFDKRKYLASNRFFDVYGKAQYKVEKSRVSQRKDWLFYFVVGMLFFMAILRLSYYKYFNNLFRLFFKTTLRQNQLRDQLLQSQLSGLLYNLFFFVASGTYLFLLARHYDVSVTGEKWQQLGTCIGILALLYIIKYAVLQATGWVFGIPGAIETYIFIVFLINKVLGLLLVPFIILIAFAGNNIVNVSLTLSLLMISGMFIYRFIRSYLPIQNDIKVSRFHFFLYLCAFEITPLLLIYKVLMKFF